MKVKTVELCAIPVDVELRDDDELFDGWSSYIQELNKCNLDGIKLSKSEVDLNVFVIDDGGELIRLRNGEYYNVCWRGSLCRVWREDDPKVVKTLNRYLSRKL